MFEAKNPCGIFDHHRGWQKWLEHIPHGNGAGTWSTRPVGTCESFVDIVVHHVGTKITRPGDAQNGIHVGAIEVNQGALLVDLAGDFQNLIVKKAQGVWVGDHENCGAFVQF